MSRERRYHHPEVGFNYRMTNLQAALGCAQIQRFSELIERRAKVLALYREVLQGSEIIVNPRRDGVEPVCWLVVATLPGDWSGERQTRLIDRLRRDHDFDARPFFIPLHQLPPYAGLRFVNRGRARSLAISERGICLPSSNRLTRVDVERVGAGLLRALSDG